jgi:hypothetical protein
VTDWDASTWAAIAAGFAAVAAFISAFAAMTQSAVARRDLRVRSFIDAVELMEPSREARKQLRTYMRAHPGATVPTHLEARADEVCRAYDVLGFLDRKRMVDHGLVEEFYAIRLRTLWPLLGPYVALIQTKEAGGETHFWELTQFADRVKDVSHPALRKSPD